MSDGVIFDKASAQRIGNTVRTVERQAGETTGAGFASMPEVRREVIPIHNSSGYEIPFGGCVWTRNGYDGHSRALGYRPEYPGIGLFVIATSVIPAGGDGLGWIWGERTVEVDDWSNTRIKDTISPWLNQFPAHLFECGPMTVTEKLTAPYVRARLTYQRTGTVNLRQDHFPIAGAGGVNDVEIHTLIIDGRLRGMRLGRGRQVVIGAIPPA